jgi:hypothetical protein
MSLKRDILVGLGLLGILVLVVTTLVGIVLLVKKALGLLLILFGIFLLIGFSDVSSQQDYQWPSMTKKGIYLGIIAVLLGLYFLIF